MGAAGSKKERLLSTPVRGYITGEEKPPIFSFKNPSLCFFNLLRYSTADSLRQDT